MVATIALKLCFVSKHQRAYLRMQPIRPHYQVEVAGAAPLKGHVDSCLVLADGLDGVPEAVFHLVFGELVEHPGEIAAPDLHHIQVEGLAHSLKVDAAGALMTLIDERDLTEGRFCVLQLLPDSHALSNRHCLMAHVNRISAFSQLWGALDHRRSEPIALEPIRQGWPSDTGSRNENAALFADHQGTLLLVLTAIEFSWLDVLREDSVAKVDRPREYRSQSLRVHIQKPTRPKRNPQARA